MSPVDPVSPPPPVVPRAPLRGHVLVVRLDAMGDVLVSGPAVRALAHRAARVTVLAGPDGAAAARLLPGVDEVVEWCAPWIHPRPLPVDPDHVERLRTTVAGLGVDAAVVLTSFHQSALPTALVLRLAGVPWVGATSEDYPGSLLDVRHRVDESLDVPEAERALGVAAACGAALPPGDDGRLRVRPELAVPDPEVPPGAVVLHPGTSVGARAWPPLRFRETAAALAAAGRPVVVTGAPGERDLTAYVAGGAAGAAGTGEVLDLGGRTPLPRLAGVLAAADVVVVGNTGPAHLAAAVGTPVVSLFAPTVPAARWAPYGVPTRLLGDPTAPCAGTRATTCPVPGHPCLADVDASAVVAAVQQLTTQVPAGGVA